MKTIEIKNEILEFEKHLVEYLNTREDEMVELLELRGVSDVLSNISKITDHMSREIKEVETFAKGFKKSPKEKKEGRLDALKALLGAK